MVPLSGDYLLFEASVADLADGFQGLDDRAIENKVTELVKANA